jgi:tetratricopeptide (TPR) repeat protein
MAHSEVQVSRIQRAITSWERKCRERPDDAEAKAKLTQLQNMLTEFEVEEFRRRVKLQPGDQRLHYELGLRLARAGQHRDAIAAFQVARKNEALQVQALHQAGLSFEVENQPKLAERQYQDALKAADASDLDTLNALHYRLGRVAEALGNTQAAEEHYNEVAANDYGYLDVAQRLRGLN